MNTHTDKAQLYTIREVASLSGLPESTLRYYETIGLIHTITRDSSSKHRVYNEHNLELRQRYVDIKIAYWKAVASGDTTEIEVTREQTYALAQELKLPKALSKEETKEG
jgi:DNA-binding transcriptional MerR regulator